MDFTFDKVRGFLVYPPKYIELSFEELPLLLEKLPFNEQRNHLWEEYQNYLAEIRELLQTNFFQYLDGSFITQKENPKDIDVVSFVEGELLEHYEKEIEQIDQKHKNIDAYYIALYPPEHQQYESHTKAGFFEWAKQFGNTRPNKHNNLQFRKCFIKINFPYEKRQ